MIDTIIFYGKPFTQVLYESFFLPQGRYEWYKQASFLLCVIWNNMKLFADKQEEGKQSFDFYILISMA